MFVQAAEGAATATEPETIATVLDVVTIACSDPSANAETICKSKSFLPALMAAVKVLPKFSAAAAAIDPPEAQQSRLSVVGNTCKKVWNCVRITVAVRCD